MYKKDTLCEFENKVFSLNISEELYALRDSFCPAKGTVVCPSKCPLNKQHLGYSCNKNLDENPDECRAIIEKEGGA